MRFFLTLNRLCGSKLTLLLGLGLLTVSRPLALADNTQQKAKASGFQFNKGDARASDAFKAMAPAATDALQLPSASLFSSQTLLDVNYKDAAVGSQSLTSSSAPVPEASTVVSFGLLMMLALGGVVISRHKKHALNLKRLGQWPCPVSK